ncbi:hypothetical protein D3C71_2057620 [compost metagenome]
MVCESSNAGLMLRGIQNSKDDFLEQFAITLLLQKFFPPSSYFNRIITKYTAAICTKYKILIPTISENSKCKPHAILHYLFSHTTIFAL